MSDAFTNSCHYIFSPEQWASTTSKILGRGAKPPVEEEWESLCEQGMDRKVFLELVYRYQLTRTTTNFLTTIEQTVSGSPALDQYVYEFIQNAENAAASYCRFRLDENRLIVANNGSTFSAKNFYALCSFSESDWTEQARVRNRPIGKFGQGFKSVFRICRRPLVVSWKDSDTLAFELFGKGGYNQLYHAALEQSGGPLVFPADLPASNNQGRERHLASLGYFFPVHKPKLLPVAEKQYKRQREKCCQWAGSKRHDEGTVFILPLRDDLKCEPDHVLQDLDPRCFLFLKNVERLEVKKSTGSGRVWRKERDDGPAPELSVVHLQEIGEDGETVLNDQRVLQYEWRTGTVDPGVLDGLDESQRQAARGPHSLMLVAPLDKDGNIPEPGVNDQPFQHVPGCIIMGVGKGLRLSTPPRQGCVNHHVLAPVPAPTLMPALTLAAPRVCSDLRDSSVSNTSSQFRMRFSHIARRCPSASWSAASWNRSSMRRLWKSFSRNTLPSNTRAS